MEEVDREFIDDQASKVITNAVEKVFGGKIHIEKDSKIILYKAGTERERQEVIDIKYDKEKATMWTAALIDDCIKELVKLQKP